MDRRVRIFDTTLRDGEQTPGVHLTADRKVELAARIEAYGVAAIEAGFPASSPGEMDAVSRVARAVTRCEVAALARCVAGDVDAAARAVEPAVSPVIHVFLGTSDIHLGAKLGMTRPEAVRAIGRAVTRAALTGAAVQFSAEDATRSDWHFLRQCVDTAIGCGATRINIPDTVGCALPEEYGALIRRVVQVAGSNVIVSAHCHNDMGLATANSVAAVQAGADQVEVTVNGIGERAGNAASEEVAVVLALKKIAETGVDLRRVTALSREVGEATGVVVQPNRAIVGDNAFAHSSGIHQDGILKDASNYEFVSPALVGAAGHRFVLTARSGRSAIVHEAREMGFRLSPDAAEAVYVAFVAEAERSAGAVSRETLAAIVEETCRGVSHEDVLTV
ncbi:MAG: 2-isopropylmalate synthase [FCB group bacterium]|nr:2-isopropylmalate synthase [FCB group bacterium]